jgi:23S rRNA pseudouridine1911/1915/1917 synthase
VRTGQQIEVNLASALARKEIDTAAPEIPIVKMTSDFIVVDKPSGLFSAPTPESDANDLLHFLKKTLEQTKESNTELFLVHRLDRPTSGLMVLARNKKAAAYLSEQVAEHSMTRRYQAVLVGSLPETVVQTSLIDGKEAETTFTPLETRGPATWVSARLGTGRTHQVRIHADALSAPVAGDSKYGRSLQRALTTRPPRLALHACELTFRDPATQNVLQLASPWPRDLAEWWGILPDSSTSV